MKDWCAELKRRSDRVVKASRCAYPFVEVASEKVLNLSHSLLEMSMSSTIKKDTAEKNVGTDDLLPISRSVTNRPATNDIGQARSALGNQPKQEGPIPENRKRKSKMKVTRPTAVVFNKEGLTYAEMLKKIRQDTSIRS